MKFSSPANIALASIALSSPSLLSSPVFVNAAPTGDQGSLSPNLGAGYFGTSPQMHATDSPVMPTMPSPSTSKIAGRRRSLRRSRSIKHSRGEKSSRTVDPLGLGVSAGNIQSQAESIIPPRMASAGSFTGVPGTIDLFSPVVGPGGLLSNTGLVPPNTPMLGGVPLSNGVDPSTLLGAIPAMVPTPGVDNVIPIIQNTAPSPVLSPLAGSLPFENGLSPNLGAVPTALPQVPSAATGVLGNVPQLPGGISPQGVATHATGAAPQLLGVLSSVPGVPQVQPGSLPVAVPDVNGPAPPTTLPNLGASPNTAMPSITSALPQVPGLQASDPIPQISGVLPQTPGGTGALLQVPGVVSQLPAGPLPKVNPDLATPSLAGAPVSVGSGIPLASPVVPLAAPGVPTASLLALAPSVVPFSALPTPVSPLGALSTSTTDHLTQPIESLPSNPLGTSSNSVPHILVSSPDAIGMFEPLEGVESGAMGRPDVGAQTKSKRPEGIPTMESGESDRSGVSKGAQITSGIKSTVESGATSSSERPMADRTTSELAPTTLASPIAKLDVPTITKAFASKPTPTDAQLASSPESTLHVKEAILPISKRWGPKAPSLVNDIASSATDKSGSPIVPKGVQVPGSSAYVPPPARLTGPGQDSPSVSSSASMDTLKSFSMASITESAVPVPIPAQTAPPVLGGIRSPLDNAQPTDLASTFSDDSLSGHSFSDERPLHVSSTTIAVASSPIQTLYSGGAPLGRTLERSADTPLSTVAISGDSPDTPSPNSLGSGTSTDSQDTATRKIFRWGVPKMVRSRFRSAATAVKK